MKDASETVSTPVPVPLVCVGASAEGLDAATAVLGSLPREAACLLVLDRRTPGLAGALSRSTGLEVVETTGPVQLAPGRIYVVPDGVDLHLEGDALAPGRPDAVRDPLDRLFESMARDRGDRAIGVVLAGAASDGAAGSAAIHRAGGTVLLQDPDEDAADRRVHAVIDAGVPDEVLPLFRLGPAIADSVRDAYAAELDRDVAGILAVLARRRRHDFDSYRPGVLRRRIRRRMAARRVDDLGRYRVLLETDPAEHESLVHEILARTTRFFRDEETIHALQAHVLPDLVRWARRDRPLRIWVPGCATGEEAYAVLILLREALAAAGKDDCPVQLFGTDLDQRSIERARRNLHPTSIEGDVSPERLARWFRRDDHGWRIDRSIRGQATFAVQDVLADPPLSRLHLVWCRNLLAHRSVWARERLLSLLHFALQPRGYLVLGPEDAAGLPVGRFFPVDSSANVHRRGGPTRWPLVSGRPVRSRGQPIGAGRTGGAMPAAPPHPCGVLVGPGHEVIDFLGSPDPFLDGTAAMSGGTLLDLVAREIRPPLRALLHMASRRDGQDEVSDVATSRDLTIRIGVRRLLASDALLVLLEAVAPGSGRAAGDDEIGCLHAELQRTLDELDRTTEERRLEGEEMRSIQEEFQSTCQELESSQEELQARGDELAAANRQLEEKVVDLEEATDDLENLLASTDIGTVFLDRSGRVKRFTPAMRSLFRLSPDDAGRPLAEVPGEVDDPALAAAIREVLETGSPREREVSSRSGQVFLRRIRPYRTDRDRVDGVVLTYVDITARKRSERERAELAAIVQSTQEAIVGTALDRTVTSWNPGAERLFGYPAAGAIGRDVLFLVPDDRQGELAACYDRLAAGERIEPFATVRLARDGRRVDVRLSLSPVVGTDGAVLGVATVASDIGDLLESERRFRVLADGAPVLVWMIDEDDQASWFNQRWLAYTGATMVDCLGAGWQAFVHPEDLALLPALQAADVEFRLRRSDGEHRWHAARGSTQRDPATGEVRRVLCAVETQSRREAQRALEEADRRKDVFLAALGHELRNPLAALRSASQLLLTQPASPRLVATIQSQLDRMSRLLDDLLDVARISQGGIELALEVFDALPSLRRIEAAFREDSQVRRIAIDLDLPAGAVPIEADPTRFEQVLCDLVTNAIVRGRAGGRIALTARVGEPWVEVFVEDDGEELDAATNDRMFDPFAGLGLALARRIVELHGGRLDALRPASGRGNSFRATFPSAPGRLPSTTAPTLPPESCPRRVLVVDDDVEQAELLTMLLTERGHEVEVAHSGEEALERVPAFRPDIVFLDLGMPRISGYEVASELRRMPERSSMRLVALSGYGHEDARRRSLAAGFDDHLVKGSRLGDLVAVVEAIA